MLPVRRFRPAVPPGACAFLLAVACASDELGPGSGLTKVLDGVESPVFLDPDSKLSDEDAPYDLYDPKRLPTFKLTLDQEVKAQLEHDAREYVPATLELIEGDATETLTVGVRLKGNGSFRPLSGKASFRIKIDKYEDDQRLHGLKDLTLNNMIQDLSLMAERLAYTAFRELGAAAPRANHARVYVDGEYFGIYANIETPNEDFLARWFEDPSRNLYEQNGRDFDHRKAVASFELETNEKHQDDRELLRALHEASAAGDLARARELVDWPKFLLFSALEASVNQVDGYSYAQTVPNNYRIYDSDNGVVFIPWGLDWALSNVITQDGGYHLDPFWVRPSHGVLMRMCLADRPCTEEYAETVRTVAQRWDALNLETLMDEWSEQIDEAFRADERREVSVEQSLQSRELRREIIHERAQSLHEAVEQHLGG